MVFGDPARDRFPLNHDTVWSGAPDREFADGAVTAQEAAAAIARARAAVRAGDALGADAAVRRLQQRYSQAYLPLGELVIEAIERGPTPSRRSLSLDDAVHVLDADGFRRRAFVSAEDEVLAVLTDSDDPASYRILLDTSLRRTASVSSIAPASSIASRSSAVDGSAELVVEFAAPRDVAPTHEAVDPPIDWGDRTDGVDGDRVRGAIALALRTDGAVAVDDAAGPDGVPALVITGATRLAIVLAVSTTFTTIGRDPDRALDSVVGEAVATAARAIAVDTTTLLARHRDAHAALYGRVDLRLGPTVGADVLVDTASRLAAARSSPLGIVKSDPGLVALLFNFGRYLLIASSRPGALPANLQGIWNDQLQPPWSSNWTVNVNTQMNYWGAEIAGLPETVEPLFDLIDALAEHGAEVASRLYAARGWAAHHNTDAWAYASPVGLGAGNPSWAFWPMAGPWLVRHYAERLAHGGADGVAARAWPVVRGAAEFLLDWFEEVAPGRLGTVLSTAPENEFVVRDARGERVGSAAVWSSSALDLELARECWGFVVGLADRLGLADDPVALAAGAALAALPGPEIAADGTIAEWAGIDEVVDPRHRHLSMLYGLYPGGRRLTARELVAARRSLDVRGDDSAGWSLVWKLALRARLGDADRVGTLIELMLQDARVRRGEWSGGVYPSLLAAHPPFQIDANLGFVGALGEALVHSHHGRIVLLPALPPSLPDGEARGLVLRGGVELDVVWRGGELVHATLRGRPTASAVDRWPVDDEPAGVRSVEVAWAGRVLSVPLAAGSSTTVHAEQFEDPS